VESIAESCSLVFFFFFVFLCLRSQGKKGVAVKKKTFKKVKWRHHKQSLRALLWFDTWRFDMPKKIPVRKGEKQLWGFLQSQCMGVRLCFDTCQILGRGRQEFSRTDTLMHGLFYCSAEWSCDTAATCTGWGFLFLFLFFFLFSFFFKFFLKGGQVHRLVLGLIVWRSLHGTIFPFFFFFPFFSFFLGGQVYCLVLGLIVRRSLHGTIFLFFFFSWGAGVLFRVRFDCEKISAWENLPTEEKGTNLGCGFFVLKLFNWTSGGWGCAFHQGFSF